METLPFELIRHISSFVPPCWLRLCNRAMADKYFKDQKFQTLISWFRLQQQMESRQQTIVSYRTKLQTLESGYKRFRNYKDVDKYNKKVEQMKADIACVNSQIVWLNKQKHILSKQTLFSNHILESRYQCFRWHT